MLSFVVEVDEMRQYSISKVKGDFYGLGSRLGKLSIIKAHNYDEAVTKSIVKLHLKKGDVLSIIALQGTMPVVKGIGLPGRYEYEI